MTWDALSLVKKLTELIPTHNCFRLLESARDFRAVMQCEASEPPETTLTAYSVRLAADPSRYAHMPSVLL